MKKDFIAMQSISIHASPDAVWDALINPATIKKYLFGTEAISDWKAGSQIIYRGIWEGKTYEDKGTILKIIPGKLLESSYWSGISGLEDIPENYKKVAYKIKPEENGVELTVTQDNNADEEEKTHSEQNWKMVLEGLKKILEE